MMTPKIIKLLIVDDSKMIGDKLSEMLQDIPELVILPQAPDAASALQLIKQELPDMLLLDIELGPGYSGFDVLRWCRKKQMTIKILMMTNHPGILYRQKCFDLRADYFIDKSQEFEKIPEILMQLIQNHACH